MSHRGGRGGRGDGRGSRGGRFDSRSGHNNSNSQSNSASSNAVASAPPPSIDESPVRAGATSNPTHVHSNVALTSSANTSSNKHNSRNQQHRGGANASATGTPTVSGPPEPVGPSPNKYGPQSVSPLSTDAICRSTNVTPINAAAGGNGKASSHRGSVVVSSIDNEKAKGDDHHEASTGGYERPPIVPQRSSFEVTASPSAASAGSRQQVSGQSSNGNLLGGIAPSAASPNSASSPPANPTLSLGNALVDKDTFIAAKASIHNAPRPVLAAILASILDDYHQLAPIIKFRFDRAMSAVANQQQQQQQQMLVQQQIPLPTSNGFWGGAQHSMGMVGGATSSGSNSPARKRSFRGRGGEDEQQLCGVHGALRSAKHLRVSDNGTMYECVPGFHCLETSASNSNGASPTKGDREMSAHGLQASAGPFVPHRASFSSPPTPPPGTMDPPFAVQGLFHPTNSGMHQQQASSYGSVHHSNLHHGIPQTHLMHTGSSAANSYSNASAPPVLAGGVGMARQNTQPPMSAAAAQLLTGVASDSNGRQNSGGHDDDNLEELLKNLHLASSQF